MKRKSIVCLTSLLLCTTMLSACKGANYKIAFNPYWQHDVDSVPEQTYEQLVYDVAFTDAATFNNYRVQYKDGTYTTTLTSKKENGVLLYEYTTRLDISVSFISGSIQSDWFENYVQSTVVFQSAANALAPVSSHKEILSHSPMNREITAETDFEDWKEYCTVDADFMAMQSKVVFNPGLETQAEETSTIEIDDEKYSYLDNEQVLFALRAINPSTNSSSRFLVHSPFSRTTQTISATFGAKITEENLSFTQNGQAVTADVAYYPVTLGIVASNSGQQQTVWIAAAGNVKNNQYRNMILRYETPISYGLGTLVYKLKSATYTIA